MHPTCNGRSGFSRTSSYMGYRHRMFDDGCLVTVEEFVEGVAEGA